MGRFSKVAMVISIADIRAFSSAGRATRLHRVGRQFDPVNAHHSLPELSRFRINNRCAGSRGIQITIRESDIIAIEHLDNVSMSNLVFKLVWMNEISTKPWIFGCIECFLDPRNDFSVVQ